MTLTAKDVAEITRLLEESSFDELHLELDGLKLSLRRGGAASPQQSGADREPASEPLGAQPESHELPVGGSPAAETLPPNEHTVTAPMLGTFYRAPKPGAPPFVEVGSDVEEGTIIGIIEVMKLMNTVRAGMPGRVLEILAQDGGLVEYSQPLLRIQTQPSA